ncbi:hypothetical protein Stsp02_55380 [Streptomyces sp. NBRC 14336]|nr:hypothetical protein Stsp02_55380 [Streptomyces sp. NBRC 14336]
MAHVPYVLVVGTVVDEHPERLADLVGREAHALGRVHRREHVLDERRQFGAEVRDLPGGGVQNRVAVQGEGPDTPVGAGDRAVSHGRKTTADSGVRMDLDRLTTYDVGRIED